MTVQAKRKALSAYKVPQMERYWALENAFLSAFSRTEHNLDVRRNQLLLSAVMFGGLLNASIWPAWLAAVMVPLRQLAKEESPGEKRLSDYQTRCVPVGTGGRRWFADPLTHNLLGRPVQPYAKSPLRGPSYDTKNDYERLLHAKEGFFIEEVAGWVLAAATTKASLYWPSLVVEHCTGALTSTSLGTDRWDALEREDHTTDHSQPGSELDYIRTVRPDPMKIGYFWFKDKGFHFIRAAIVKAIDESADCENPTLSVEQEKLRSYLEDSESRTDEGDLGWWVKQWFLAYCAATQPPDGPTPVPKRARTLLDHAFALGASVDWADLWQEPLETIHPELIVEKLHAALRNRPEGFGAANRLFVFLGFGELLRPDWLREVRKNAGIKSEVLSKTEFNALLPHLLDRTGKRGAHWLATMLMFRCGLRPREIVALEIDHITIIDDIVELKVAATPYVALKNKTSARTLPLHALLSADELGELLRWRALRIRDCKGKRKHARLLFATVYHPHDYDFLLEPIEHAIRIVTGQKPASFEERKKPSYVFARCSILRHSFVSYAVATMLVPRDDGGFQMPPGITPDLVSVARRERLERALLSQGHLGLSSLEAVRQMTGHARYTRTIGTYTHLMDLVAGAYTWRRSFEPSLPATVLCKLPERKIGYEKRLRGPRASYAIDRSDADPPLNERTLSYYAREQSAAEQAEMEIAISSLRKGEALEPLVIPRARRPRGKEFPSWMPQGNAFLSQLRNVATPAGSERGTSLPEWRRDEVDDWRTADQIVQMASRGVPARLIADQVGVRLGHVERLARRYQQLLSLRRRATARGEGKLRHNLLLQNPDACLRDFDDEVLCWYSAIRPVRSTQGNRADALWIDILRWREDQAALTKVREFLCKHQDGRIMAKRRAPLDLIAKAFNGLMVVKGTERRDKTSPNPSRFFELKRQEEHPPRDREDWLSFAEKRAPSEPEKFVPLRTVTLLHLLLLAEAISHGELPAALIASPAESSQTDVRTKKKEFYEQREALRQEAARKAAQAKEDAKKARRKKLKEEQKMRMLGLRTYGYAVISASASHESRQASIQRAVRARRVQNELDLSKRLPNDASSANEAAGPTAAAPEIPRSNPRDAAD